MIKATIQQYLELLKKKKHLTAEQYAECVTQSFSTFEAAEKYIKQRVLIADEDTAKIKAELYSVDYALLVGKPVSLVTLSLLPKDLAENYATVVFDRVNDTISVGITDPSNFKAIEAVNFMAMKNGFKVRYFVISNDSYRAAMKQYGTLHEEVGEALTTAQGIFGSMDEFGDSSGTQTMEDLIKSAPVTKIISVILRHAIEGRASDIHIEPLAAQSRIRYRIDGILHTTLLLPIYVHAALISRIKVMASLKIDETRVPQDGRIRLNIFNKDVDFRISTIPLMNYEKVVMRILTTPDHAPSFQELGFNGLQLAAMERNSMKPNGMFLVTGPTGSGKSTTLFAALSLLNKEAVNITTLEDPVEYFVTGVNQSSIRPEVGFTFANGLRALLRQDPNIIMVGEIRDNETASLAIQASLTGHSILSTLHTNDALGAVPRLFDMRVEPFLLANTLNIVMAQRLVRMICEHCKQVTDITPDVFDRIKQDLSSIPEDAFYGGITKDSPLQFYRGTGCARCGHSGYAGRMTIVEAVEVTPALREMITTGFRTKDVSVELQRQHFITMKQDGIIKALQAKTTLEEVLMASEER